MDLFAIKLKGSDFMELKKFYPRCTVSVLTDQFNEVYFDVPIQNMLYRNRISGLYGYFDDLPGVHHCDLHLTGDLSQVPYNHLLNTGISVQFTISGIGPVRAFFSSEGFSFDSFCVAFHEWFSSFSDLTERGYVILVKGK